MGTAFGPIGAFLPELFDANVRYSAPASATTWLPSSALRSCRPSPLGCRTIGVCIPWVCIWA